MATEQQILELQNQYPKLAPFLEELDFSNPNSETYKALVTLIQHAGIQAQLKEAITHTQSQFQDRKEQMKEYTQLEKSAGAKKNPTDEYKKDSELLKNLLAQFKELQEELKKKAKEFEKIMTALSNSFKQQTSNEDKLLKLLLKEKPNLDVNEAKATVKFLLDSDEANQIKKLATLEIDPDSFLDKAAKLLEKDKQIKNQMKEQTKQAQETNSQLTQLLNAVEKLTNILQKIGQYSDKPQNENTSQNEPQAWMKAGWSTTPKMEPGKNREEDDEDAIEGLVTRTTPGLKK